MTETRRQVIGINSKLPISALRYLDALQQNNAVSAEAAFTMANMKAVPKGLTNEEAVVFLIKMSHFNRILILIQKAMVP